MLDDVSITRVIEDEDGGIWEAVDIVLGDPIHPGHDWRSFLSPDKDSWDLYLNPVHFQS